MAIAIQCERGHEMQKGWKVCPECGASPKTLSVEDRLSLLEEQVAAVSAEIAKMGKAMSTPGTKDDQEAGKGAWQRFKGFLTQDVSLGSKEEKKDEVKKES